MDTVSEKEKEKIKEEAKQILDNFSKVLEKVKIKEIKKSEKKEVGGFREEGPGKLGSGDFRKRMFENAPIKDGDFIIAEKKKWS